MRIQLAKESTGNNSAVKKAVAVSVVANVFEIIAAAVMVLLVMLLINGGIEEALARVTAIVCLGVITWGAVMDLGKTFENAAVLQRERALEEAFVQLEALNREMRSQRHDFMNHIQVIYSLIEMEEPQEALRYIDNLYGDMQRVSKMLRTDSPAVNALIQAKSAEAQRRGIDFILSIDAKWNDPMMPAWKLCRVLGNLIDNAMDASESAALPDGMRPRVELVLNEDQNNWYFSVRNNGPAIPEEVKEQMFEAGYTTKSSGHGMGLYIVSQIVAEMGGQISVKSENGETVFSAYVPREGRLQLPEGREQETVS